jgi:hypothetical protein
MAGVLDGNFTTPLVPACPSGDSIDASDFDPAYAAIFQPTSWDYYKV